MTARLTGKTALVTGAGSGIGRAIADRFVEEGARVVYADRDARAAADAAGAAGPGGVALTMDIADEGSVEAGYAVLADQGDSPDVVVANAGVQLFGHDARVADVSLETWNRTVAVNLTGTFLTVKHAVRAMLPAGGGSIIATGSPTGLNGEGADFAAYSSTKGGIHALVRATAMAYARDGIRVNTVVPGYTETSLVSTISGDPASRAAIVSRTPLGRPGTPDDVTGIMVYLASDESSYATGAVFRVDGGMTSL
ncbi:NAD(P)-dependent dehydrogenase (short-subunit alcohol dehydrogenase family) [Curtobacterium pusillum]|uniref:NAD(P)-dependent dehydrogenase (Short-subunit alcohol dehydrogenase family) n=1 Tax=Curtobacterium pusillum TaxID=69373 RepID=A0AAW3TBD2_9MICO|nr:SDR family NAD(P)-dependent oxidoreductase [Curtobacterium pusillum]MBA8991602.1 NAD(P)-dependent dehydrogenase (short-subunit alcohol dehydrogenase family) [Curtobacterium pusillum]